MTNIRKNLLRGLLVTAIALVAVGSVFAGSLTLSGSLDAGDPTFDSPLSNCGSVSLTNANYDSYTFEVDTAGSYSLEISLVTLGDSVLVLYSPSFNPGASLSNCLAANDDGGTGLASKITWSMVPDTPYIAVVRGYGNSQGSYTLNISGPGEICLGGCSSSADGLNILPEPFTTDGRINGYDGAAPVAVYGQDMVGGRGLVIYSDEGALLVTIAPDLLVAPTDGNQLIASNESAQVYVFMQPDGQWHVQAWTRSGKWYHLMTDMMYAHSVNYSSWEE